MICTQQRQILLSLIRQACDAGARLHKACALIGLAARTLQRRLLPQHDCDGRAAHKRAYTRPANKLSDLERAAALGGLSSEAFKDLPPSQIVLAWPIKANTGAANQRCTGCGTGPARWRIAALSDHPKNAASRVRRRPRCLTIYCRDITCLPTQLRGAYFYLYLFVDIFSRKIVGRQVFDCARAQRAAQLLQDICLRLGIRPGQLTVHSDNGGPMKGATMPATMQRLGVAQTRSRPAVSNVNPCSESRFKTLKYRPPGADRALLRARTKVCEQARQSNPLRWSKQTRNWQSIDSVHLNPDTP